MNDCDRGDRITQQELAADRERPERNPAESRVPREFEEGLRLFQSAGRADDIGELARDLILAGAIVLPRE